MCLFLDHGAGWIKNKTHETSTSEPMINGVLVMWLRECYRQTKAEVICNSRTILHQTTCKYYFPAQNNQTYRIRNFPLSRMN